MYISSSLSSALSLSISNYSFSSYCFSTVKIVTYFLCYVNSHILTFDSRANTNVIISD